MLQEKCCRYCGRLAYSHNTLGSMGYQKVMSALTHKRTLILCSFSIFLCLFLELLFNSTTFFDSFRNLLINEGYIKVNRELQSPDGLALAYMKSTSVTFLCLGKNVGSHLPGLLDQVDRLGSLFQRFNILFVDGDSTDNTKDLYQDYISRSRAISKLYISVSSENWVENLSGQFFGKPLSREGRIAIARNAGLAELNKISDVSEFIIMVDADILGWNMDGVVNNFKRHDKWDIVCADGVMFNGIYRDVYAFRAPEIDTNHHWLGMH